MKNLFGTDGIRFIYTKDILEIIKKVSNSLALLKTNKIIIGNDTRYSKEEILNVIKDYTPNNIKIYYVNEISTPGICYLSLKYKCLGLIITASHNDYTYNGIKIFDKGYKLDTSKILRLENFINNLTSPIEYKNKLIISNELKEEYLSFLESNIQKSKYRMGFDLSNGSLSSYGKRIAIALNKDNMVFNSSPNGYNINKSVGALFPQHIQELVVSNNLDYGFCFDGDADRVLLVDKKKIYTGDELLYYLCNCLKIKKHTLVITPYSNKGLIESLSKQSIHSDIVPPGDENILERLINNNLSLGGENAGHIILLDYLPTGDGFLNSIIISNLLNKYPIDVVLKGYSAYFNKLVNIKLKNKSTITNPIIQHYINEQLKIHSSSLDLFVRPSGTENLLRIYICHKNKNVALPILNKLITLIQIIDNDISVLSYDGIIIDENSTFGKNITLEGSCIIQNSKIEDNVIIISSCVKDSIIESSCQIGPFTHIHKNSHIGKENKIGNFTEIKNSITGSSTKASHLSYIGDCICGSDVNFGCGSIIVNYDGLNKHQCVINDKVFIGCNSNLISPLIIGSNAFIAAGSTITKSINELDFVIARSKETIKEKGAIKYPYYINKNYQK